MRLERPRVQQRAIIYLGEGDEPRDKEDFLSIQDDEANEIIISRRMFDKFMKLLIEAGKELRL